MSTALLIGSMKEVPVSPSPRGESWGSGPSFHMQSHSAPQELPASASVRCLKAWRYPDGDICHSRTAKSMQRIQEYGHEFRHLQPGLQPPRCRHNSRLQDIYHRPFRKMLRDKRRQHCHPRDALLDLTRGPHPVPAAPPDQEYKGPSRHLLRSRMLTHGIAARLDHLRTDFPYHRSRRPLESEETGHSVRGPDLSL